MSTPRRQLADLMCAGCACRPGTRAHACSETQALLEEAGTRFSCHLPRDGGGRPVCAGAVARWGSDAEVAEALSGLTANPALYRWAAVGEMGLCGHSHASPAEAWACAQRIPGEHAVVQLLVDDGWIIPDAATRAALAPLGARWPVYWHVVGAGWRCDHAHWSLLGVVDCWLEYSHLHGAEIRRHDTWPVLTGDEGVAVDEEEMWKLWDAGQMRGVNPSDSPPVEG